MSDDLKIYPNQMGEDLNLTVTFNPNSGIVLTDSTQISITAPNLRTTELNGGHLFLKSKDIKNINEEILEEGKFLCSTEETSPYDTTKIAVVLLDGDLQPTSDIAYFTNLDDADAYCNSGKTGNNSKRFLIVIGENAGITLIPDNQFVYQYGRNRYKNQINYGPFKVIIPSTVTSIGASAFYNCNYLTYIELTDGLIAIEEDAFYNTNLQYIHFPASIRSIKGFDQCTYTKDITFQNGVEEIYSTFYPANSFQENELNMIFPSTVVYSNGCQAYAKTIEYLSNSIRTEKANMYVESPYGRRIILPDEVTCKNLYIGNRSMINYRWMYVETDNNNFKLPSILHPNSNSCSLYLNYIKGVTEITIPSCISYEKVSISYMPNLVNIYANAPEGSITFDIRNSPNAQIIWG